MNKKYGGLVFNPRNTKDTQVVKSITYTTNGTVVETVNLNAWPAATESNTPEPTPFVPTLFNRTSSGDDLLVDNDGKLVMISSLIYRKNGVGSYVCTNPSGHSLPPTWGVQTYQINAPGQLEVNGSVYEVSYDSLAPGNIITINPAPENYPG